MSNHNQSLYLRLSSDSLVTLLFLRRIQYTGCQTDTAVINVCLILGVDRNSLFVVRKFFSAEAFNEGIRMLNRYN